MAGRRQPNSLSVGDEISSLQRSANVVPNYACAVSLVSISKADHNVRRSRLTSSPRESPNRHMQKSKLPAICFHLVCREGEEVVWATGGEGGRLPLSAASAAASIFRGAGCPRRSPVMEPDWSIQSERHFCGAGAEGRGRALRNGDGLTDRMTRTAKPAFPRACIMLPSAGAPGPISPRGRQWR